LEAIVTQVAGLAVHGEPRRGVGRIMIEVTGSKHHTIEAILATDLKRAMRYAAANTAPFCRLFGCQGELWPVCGILGTLEGQRRPQWTKAGSAQRRIGGRVWPLALCSLY
jgi:hypothetical protein